MRRPLLTLLLLTPVLLTTAWGRMPAAKAARLTSAFGNAPLNATQLQALNEILAVSEPGTTVVERPAPAAPARPAKTTKLKTKKKDEPEKQDDNTRTIEVDNAAGETSTLMVDTKAGIFRNLKVPPAQAPAVKAFLTSLNLAGGAAKR